MPINVTVNGALRARWGGNAADITRILNELPEVALREYGMTGDALSEACFHAFADLSIDLDRSITVGSDGGTERELF